MCSCVARLANWAGSSSAQPSELKGYVSVVFQGAWPTLCRQGTGSFSGSPHGVGMRENSAGSYRFAGLLCLQS